MKMEELPKSSEVKSSHRIYSMAAVIGLALILLVGGVILKSRQPLAVSLNHISKTSTPTGLAPAIPASTKPLYFKKELAFKRTMPESEYPSIRSSALTEGYKALSAISPEVVAPPVSVRDPQFPNASAFNNYQALSTLGTQQYYSNLNVQQYLRDLSIQQNFNSLTNQQRLNQQWVNNMNTQTYLNNINTWENTTVLNAQTYLNNLQTQQTWNTFNNQQYLNNWNTFSNPSYFQPITPNQPITPIRPMTPIQPMPQIYIPPPSYHFP